jgi:hypothetical protein
VLRQTVLAASSLPLTRSPLVRTITLLILPRTALTVIPRFGAVSIPPLAGVIDNRTPSGAAPELAWLPDPVSPEQPAARKPSVAQIATVASLRPRDPTDREEAAPGMATGRNLEPPYLSKTAYAASAPSP